MPTQILKDIKNRVEEETRSPQQIYSELRFAGAQMMLTNTITRGQVVGFCAGLIKLYDMLSPKSQTADRDK